MKKFVLHLVPLILLGCGSGVQDLMLTGVCDGYSAANTSPYVVPWASGTTRKVAQGNCGPASHYGSDKYAYDFDFPIGTNIVAARAGTVYKVVESKSDGNGCASGDNHIYITHADGTTARYVHLTHNGALVAEGDIVTQGQVIGISGNTGCSSGPHLHFQVNSKAEDGISVPVTFSNVGTNSRGLQTGREYRAQ
ncbi:MAG: M23 family metallopeptidase [Pseudobdellovibrionaceae bacterium]